MTGWCKGCRCQKCRDAHNADLRRRRRRKSAVASISWYQRKKLLQLITDGVNLVEAARSVGVMVQSVHALRRRSEAWAAALDAALIAGRDPSLEHGREMTYRHHARNAEPHTRKGRTVTTRI